MPEPIPLPEAARLSKALSDKSRLGLLLFLHRHGEAAVRDLALAAGVPLRIASRHLAHLRRTGLVGYRREGRCHYYRLDSPRAADLLRDVGPG
jgi:DNA-binding transcriptional ArsR family regulator